MSSEKADSGAGQPYDPSGAFTQEFQHQQVSARVPEKVKRGVFSTGALVLQGANEFVIDFMLSMMQPHQISARVVLPPGVMGSFIQALQENYRNYQEKFGGSHGSGALAAGQRPPAGAPGGAPTAPPSPPPQPPSIEDIYDQLKISDDMLSGVYANAVMIAHTHAEFCFDFITTFYPRSAVSARVYLSAPQIPSFLNVLQRSFQQYQQKLAALQQQHQHRPPPQAGS
ncbi:MAG: DUF3467 domain-containing protein [Gemmataceae bacterium]|nr:DUF3467 domain-containing protein [Gemmataceae bacterium]MDW8264912.1 DUF3467 domain-containing protein [Gemmataceae bacterium]